MTPDIFNVEYNHYLWVVIQFGTASGGGYKYPGGEAGVCIIITPNRLVNWNVGNLHIAVNLNGNATYDNRIDQARIHGG